MYCDITLDSSYGEVARFLRREGTHAVSFVTPLNLRTMCAEIAYNMPVRTSVTINEEVYKYSTVLRYRVDNGLATKYSDLHDWVKKEADKIINHPAVKDLDPYITGSSLGWWVHPEHSTHISRDKKYLRKLMGKSDKSDIDVYLRGAASFVEGARIIKRVSKEVGVKANYIEWWGVAIPTERSREDAVIPSNRQNRCSREWRDIFNIIKDER